MPVPEFPRSTFTEGSLNGISLFFIEEFEFEIEFSDKLNYAIFPIPHFNFKDVKFISNESSILKKQLDKNVNYDEKLDRLFKSLKTINAKLWIIEDDKRQCEKEKDFTNTFIKLSRDVHFLNDDRAKIKLEINNHTGSKIKEIKEYTSY